MKKHTREIKNVKKSVYVDTCRFMLVCKNFKLKNFLAEYHSFSMGNSSVWLDFDLSIGTRVHYYSWREHLRMGKAAKFGYRML